VGFAKLVAEEYATLENGYHAKLRMFLCRACRAHDIYCESPDAFEELKQDPFWENSRQKPKDLTTSRWVLYFVMQATESKDRARATKYAAIIEGFKREGVKSNQLPDRIVELGGIEAAYRQIVDDKKALHLSNVHKDDEESEDEGRRIPRTGELPASGDHDVKLRGEPIDVGTGSSFEVIGTAPGDRSPMRYFEPKRILFVELEPAERARIVDAGTAENGPVRFRLDLTVHPRDAGGFAHVVVDRILSAVEVAEEILFGPERDLLSIDPPNTPRESKDCAGARRTRAKEERNVGEGSTSSSQPEAAANS
jgi:hypothetical protein